MAHRTLNPRTERKITLNVMSQRYTPPKNFGNLLPQVNFQTPLQVDPGTFTPIRPWLKTNRMYKNEMKTTYITWPDSRDPYQILR